MFRLFLGSGFHALALLFLLGGNVDLALVYSGGDEQLKIIHLLADDQRDVVEQELKARRRLLVPYQLGADVLGLRIGGNLRPGKHGLDGIVHAGVVALTLDRLGKVRWSQRYADRLDFRFQRGDVVGVGLPAFEHHYFLLGLILALHILFELQGGAVQVFHPCVHLARGLTDGFGLRQHCFL